MARILPLNEGSGDAALKQHLGKAREKRSQRNDAKVRRRQQPCQDQSRDKLSHLASEDVHGAPKPGRRRLLYRHKNDPKYEVVEPRVTNFPLNPHAMRWYARGRKEDRFPRTGNTYAAVAPAFGFTYARTAVPNAGDQSTGLTGAPCLSPPSSKPPFHGWESEFETIGGPYETSV